MFFEVLLVDVIVWSLIDILDELCFVFFKFLCLVVLLFLFFFDLLLFSFVFLELFFEDFMKC